MACYVRLMRRADIAQITEIDREAFPSVWPPVNYERELRNRLAHYIVACDEEERVDRAEVEAPLEKDPPGLAYRIGHLFNYNRFFHHELLESDKQYITGFAGFWIMAGEAHIISIAVREPYRRQGIGELLLISVINLATELDTRIITLEVRASNTIAQNLYHKYGFTEAGLRRNYYIDDKEDALVMSTESITSATFQANLQRLKKGHSPK
ncbi:ribosomal protein S18-alanine N-acetyltransferase [Chloroflexota bacterium]